METEWMEQPQKRSTFFTVLLVMIFIGAGLNILLNTYSLIGALSKGSEAGVSPFLTIAAYGTLVTILVSGILMWNKNIVGLGLYYLSKIARLTIMFIIMPEVLYPVFEANEDIPDPAMYVNFVLIFYAICWAIFPVLFLFTLKQFRKAPVH